MKLIKTAFTDPASQIYSSSLGQNIDQMLQGVFLFIGSIKSNIRRKNDNITDNEIVSAKYVNTDRFICNPR